MSARIEPDRVSLEIVHRQLGLIGTLDQALKNGALKICLENIARRHMQRRDRVDVKKLQANDRD